MQICHSFHHFSWSCLEDMWIGHLFICPFLTPDEYLREKARIIGCNSHFCGGSASASFSFSSDRIPDMHSISVDQAWLIYCMIWFGSENNFPVILASSVVLHLQSASRLKCSNEQTETMTRNRNYLYEGMGSLNQNKAGGGGGEVNFLVLNLQTSG